MNDVVLQQPELDPITQAATKAELDRGIDKTTSFPVDGKAAHGSTCGSSSNGSSSAGDSTSMKDRGNAFSRSTSNAVVAAMAAAAALA